MLVINIPKSVLYVSEVASVLGYSSHFVYNLIHTGQLKAYKNAGCKSWRITVDSIQDYLNTQTQYKTPVNWFKHFSFLYLSCRKYKLTVFCQNIAEIFGNRIKFGFLQETSARICTRNYQKHFWQGLFRM